jgi:hypothetical protein
LCREIRKELFASFAGKADKRACCIVMRPVPALIAKRTIATRAICHVDSGVTAGQASPVVPFWSNVLNLVSRFSTEEAVVADVLFTL